jgi:Na+/H+ antiporter NhaD/arsenite permease-like protein
MHTKSVKSCSLLILVLIAMLPVTSFAMTADNGANILDLTTTVYGLIALLIFGCAYALVIGEEFLRMRKSKPVILAAGIIWVLVAAAYNGSNDQHTAGIMLKHNILEFAELMLFLLAAMTYINTMQDRNVFAALRGYLVSHGLSFRSIFWLTGLLAFFISPVADNLTTALVMAAVVMTIAASNKKFVVVGCINIVVAANAGGAFSPFGDITTLMVWQKGLLDFTEFFVLFIPAVVNWLVPAFFMSLAVPDDKPEKATVSVQVKQGGYITVMLFLVTIALAVSVHSYFHLPPMLGMMTGLGLLKIYGYFLKLQEQREWDFVHSAAQLNVRDDGDDKPPRPFDIFQQLQRAEWDTLMFFYGVVLSVGGLGAFGYLSLVSQNIYTPEFGITQANVLVGVLSAIVDNIPVMFAVLSMNPDMSDGQWLLVTLTAGVGGSLLSIGSAAGVALMGQARGIYTFFAHLKWSWAIALGYAASIWVHLWLNASLM